MLFKSSSKNFTLCFQVHLLVENNLHASLNHSGSQADNHSSTAQLRRLLTCGARTRDESMHSASTSKAEQYRGALTATDLTYALQWGRHSMHCASASKAERYWGDLRLAMEQTS